MKVWQFLLSFGLDFSLIFSLSGGKKSLLSYCIWQYKHYWTKIVLMMEGNDWKFQKCSCISCFSGGSYSSFCPCSAVPSSPVFCMLPGLLFPVYWWGPPLDLVSHGKLSIKWIFKEDAHVHFFFSFLLLFNSSWNRSKTAYSSDKKF